MIILTIFASLIVFGLFAIWLIIITAADATIERVKRSMMNTKSLLPKDLDVINNYSFIPRDPPHTDYENWNTDQKVLSQLCAFGFKVLESYTIASNPDKHLQIAEDIILRIDDYFFQMAIEKRGVPRKPKGDQKSTDVAVTENSNPSRSTRERREIGGVTNKSRKEKQKNSPIATPDTLDWYTFAIYVTRLMVMYEYIGKDNCIKEYICHPIVTNIITLPDTALGKKKHDADVPKIYLMRYLSNYLYDRQTFVKEQNSDVAAELRRSYYITYNQTNEVENGLYVDGSCIYYHDVATYSPMLALTGFYENLYRASHDKYNLRDYLVPVLEKLVHPNVSYVTLGIFGRDGKRARGNWYDVKGTDNAIEVMQVAGLGIFKTKDFMFSLRVQRPKIAACQADESNKSDKLALGWIQLRKIYLAGRKYQDELDWEKLIKEPGIISIVGNSADTSPKFNVDKLTSIHCQNDSVQSFIGHKRSAKLLFWKNRYNFDKYYNIDITENGVATENGVEILYTIDYRQETKHVQFRYIDDDNDTEKLHFSHEIIDNNAYTVNDGFLQFKYNPDHDTDNYARFIWRMVFNTDAEQKTTFQWDSDKMIFFRKSKKYEIIYDEAMYFKAKVYENSQVVEEFNGI